VLALLYIAQNITASRQRQKLGFGQGKPSSALVALLGCHRVLAARESEHHRPPMPPGQGERRALRRAKRAAQGGGGRGGPRLQCRHDGASLKQHVVVL